MSEISEDVKQIINTLWDVSETKSVPETTDIKLAGGARWIEATYLYADLANSSKMASVLDRRVTAKIIKSFLMGAAKIVALKNGKVVSFDGDRIMAIFTGDRKNTNAAECGLGINWLVSDVIRNKFEEKYSSISENGIKIIHGTGIDTGRALIVRGGVRGNNDLISIGRAPNMAAKMSDLRGGFTTRLSEEVYSRVHKDAKYANKDGSLMWEKATWEFLGEEHTIYRSTWWRKP